MSRFNPESLRLDICDTEACLQLHSWRHGWRKVAAEPLLPSYRFQPESLIQCLPALLQGRPPGGRLAIVLPDKAARFFMVTPPENLVRFSDLKAIAAMRFETLLGLPAADWRIEAAWQVDRPFLACALPVSLLAQLHQLGHSLGLDVTMVQPALVSGWNQLRTTLREGDWFASCGEARAVVAIAGNNEISTVFQLDLPAGWPLHPQILQPALAATRYRQQLAMPRRIYLLAETRLAWEQVELEATTLINGGGAAPGPRSVGTTSAEPAAGVSYEAGP